MNVSRGLLAIALFGGLCAFIAAPSQATDRIWRPPEPSGLNAVEAGTPVLELPTLHSISVLWPIVGDDNGDATVSVSYRQTGSAEWRKGYPLFWVHPERQPVQHHVPNGRLFAGSVVGLQPGTTYDLRLELIDPDGGSYTEQITAATRDAPDLPEGMTTRHVVPASGPEDIGGSGTAEDPFRGLAHALDRVAPGDLLLLSAGEYKAAALRPRLSGTAERPIVLRGESAGQVIIDGGGGDVALDFSDRDDIWLEQTTLRNARALLRAERTSRIVARGNTFHIAFEEKAVGIEVLHSDAHQFVISDNRFVGPNTEWPSPYKGKRTPELLNGIAIAGEGHDIAYNEITRIGDGINSGRIGGNNLEGEGLRATDIYNNDIDEARTECIEVDYSLTNVRVYENRLTNCLYGVSTQPAMGGPVYIFRNAIFNTTGGPFKLHNHASGVFLFHNTSVRSGRPVKIIPRGETVNDIMSRNNIYVGTRGPALHTAAKMIRSDFDNDGYSYNLGEQFARWNGNRYKSAMDAREGGEIYANYGPIMLFGRGEFEMGLLPPPGEYAAQPRQQNQPQLSAGSRAIDKGVALPNINDDYAGEAPDLGCCERDRPLPHFGPRSDWGTD